jgi:polyhydroxyalkanoate synthesis regulator phasin
MIRGLSTLNPFAIMRIHRYRALIPTLLTSTLLAAAGLHAAEPPKKERAFGSGKAGGAYLTRNELRVCLGRQTRVAQQDGEMQKEQSTLAATKAEIARSGEQLKERLDNLDRTSIDAVTAYNEAAEARDKQIDAYQTRVTAFNTQVEALKAEREAFGKGCDNRRYFEEDEIAIKKGK